MQQPTVETREILRSSDRLAQLYRGFELIVPALLIGVAIGVDVPGIRQRLLALPPMWANAALIGDVALLAAAGLVAQSLVERRTPLRTAEQLTLRLLGTTLILLVACIVVVLWKYLVWLIPDTWTAQGIFLEATHPGSLVDLYSIHQLDQPTIATPIYPPGYYAILRAFLAIFGQSPSVLRWVTGGAIATICAALSIASAPRRRDAWSLLAPAIFLAFFSSVIYSGAPTKPEFLASAFAMVGLALYMRRGFGASSRWWLPCCACAFAAALLVKYTVIGAFIAVTAHLLLRRQFRKCLSFLAISLGIVGAVYGTMHILTHGGVYLFTVRANAVSPQLLKVISLGALGVLPKAFVVFAVGAAYTLVLRAEDRGAPAVAVAIGIFVSLPLAVLAIGKPGSSPFYFLEPVVLGALAIALLVRRSYEEVNREAASLFPAAALLAMAVIQLPSNLALVARREGGPREQAEVRARLAVLRPAADEFVMADAYYAFDVAQAGFKPVMIDNLVYTLLVDNRIIDDRRLLALFESGKVPYLVLQNTLEWHASLGYGGRFYPPTVVDYLRRNYICESLMKRWDDAALVICRRASARSGEAPAR